MTDPTADAAKLLPERSDVFNPDELPIMIRVLERDPPVLLRHDTMRAAVLYLNAELVKANTRPQPAPPEGEPDWNAHVQYILLDVPPHLVQTTKARAIDRLREAYRLGVAVRPKVDDAEIVAHVALLRMLGCVGGPLDHAAVRKAADLLEDRAGVVSDQRDYIQRLERLLNEASNQRDSANDNLAEREAELAKADDLICSSFVLDEPEMNDKVWRKIRDDAINRHAARQQQRASAEPTAGEGE